MPFNKIPKTETEYLLKEMDALRQEIKELKKRSTPTVPIYDYTNLPADAVEGQIALMENAPALASVSMTDFDLFVVIDGGGSAITTGVKEDISLDFAATITGWTLLADTSGSIVVDIWKDTYTNYPPTSADVITASAKPTISSATKATSTTLTGWTTTINAGDTLRFNVNSASTITRCTLILHIHVDSPVSAPPTVGGFNALAGSLGLKCWTMNPSHSNAVGNTSTTPVGFSVYLDAGTVITSLAYPYSNPGSTTSFQMGIYDGTPTGSPLAVYNLLASTAAISGALSGGSTTPQWQVMALTSPLTITTSGHYFFAVAYAGSSAPTTPIISNPSSSVWSSQFLPSGNPNRHMIRSNGGTSGTLPNPLTPDSSTGFSWQCIVAL